MRNLNRRIFLFGLCGLVGLRRPLHAQFFPGVGATEITQLANHFELVAQVTKQIQQIQILLNSYYQIVQAGRLLTHMQWSNAVNDIANIGAIVQTGNSIAFTAGNIDLAMRRTYPGYASQTAGQPFYQRYRQWAQTTLDTIDGASRGYGLSYRQLLNEQQLLDRLQAQAGTVQGQTQAIQLGNEVSLETAKQIGKLREVYLADMQSKGVVDSYNIQKDVNTAQWDERFYANGKAGRDGQAF